MHKFFCNYNTLTERYELSLSRGNIFNNRISVQAEETLLPEIKENLQNLYEKVVHIKDNVSGEDKLSILDETELLISNLYYSLFASPLELSSNNSKNEDLKTLYSSAVELASQIEKVINIPEYNRLISIVKNNLQNNLNSL